jgi:hypothetical protein
MIKCAGMTVLYTPLTPEREAAYWQSIRNLAVMLLKIIKEDEERDAREADARDLNATVKDVRSSLYG